MCPEYLMRSVAIMACATTLSLVTTIAAYAAVGVVSVRSNGNAMLFAGNKAPVDKAIRLAKVPARAS